MLGYIASFLYRDTKCPVCGNSEINVYPDKYVKRKIRQNKKTDSLWNGRLGNDKVKMLFQTDPIN